MRLRWAVKGSFHRTAVLRPLWKAFSRPFGRNELKMLRATSSHDLIRRTGVLTASIQIGYSSDNLEQTLVSGSHLSTSSGGRTRKESLPTAADAPSISLRISLLQRSMPLSILSRMRGPLASTEDRRPRRRPASTNSAARPAACERPACRRAGHGTPRGAAPPAAPRALRRILPATLHRPGRSWGIRPVDLFRPEPFSDGQEAVADVGRVRSAPPGCMSRLSLPASTPATSRVVVSFPCSRDDPVPDQGVHSGSGRRKGRQAEFARQRIQYF